MSPTLCHSCNLCTKLHTHMHFTIIFCTFFSGIERINFLLCFWNQDLNQSHCPPGTMTLHCPPSLWRVRTDIGLIRVGRGGDHNQNNTKKPQTTKPQVSNSEQNLIFLLVHRTAGITHATRAAGVNKAGQLVSVPEEFAQNVCGMEPYLHLSYKFLM